MPGNLRIFLKIRQPQQMAHMIENQKKSPIFIHPRIININRHATSVTQIHPTDALGTHTSESRTQNNAKPYLLSAAEIAYRPAAVYRSLQHTY